MTPRAIRRAGSFVAVACAVVGVVVAQGCSSSPKLSAAGGECFQATDCELGLVCAPQKNGSRICTNDLSGVQATEPSPAGDGGTADAPADAPGMGEGGPGDATPPQDGAPPQDSAPPPSDAATE